MMRLFRRKDAAPGEPPPDSHVPEGLRVYAIGDIHGRSDLLDLVLSEILADANRAAKRGVRSVAVFLGDYIDRGPDSRGVIDRLISLPRGMVAWRFLEGNHEAAMCAFLAEPELHERWLRIGGAEALESYGICAPRPGGESLAAAAAALGGRLGERHRAFLDGLELMVGLGDYLFVHAGVRPGVPLEAQSRADLLTIRKPFLTSSHFHQKRVVHGHSVTDEPVFHPNRIGIDTRAYLSGRLTCLVLEGGAVELFATIPDRPAVAWSDGAIMAQSAQSGRSEA